MPSNKSKSLSNVFIKTITIFLFNSRCCISHWSKFAENYPKEFRDFFNEYTEKFGDEAWDNSYLLKRFDRVFILIGYVSHSDICKIESLGIDGKFVNSKGVNGIIREIEGCVRRDKYGLGLDIKG